MYRQTSDQEKFCVLVKARPGHDCRFSWMVVSIIQYAGVPRELADTAYATISGTVATEATRTERGCMKNTQKTCACQGEEGEEGGSYSWGCSWNMYTGGHCKFAKTPGVARKFNLNKGKVPGPEEAGLEKICNQLADSVSSVLQRLAPSCFNNMTFFSPLAQDCRIGSQEGGRDRPFSGVTVVSDFCAHQHHDTNNMAGGCTVVLSLTRPENRDNPEPDDEQFHVLPQYEPDATTDELQVKEENGGLDVLKEFRRTIVIRQPEEKKCLRGKPSVEKKKLLDGALPINYSPSPKKPRKEENNNSPQNLTFNPAAPQQLKSERKYETDCKEVILDREVGGLALALPHGSLLLEVAKEELHATTALRSPNKKNPCRVGLVFYQHGSLHLPQHGKAQTEKKNLEREFTDYLCWLAG